METKIEFEWQKYEKRLLDLENRLKCRLTGAGGKESALISPPDISSTADDNEPGAAAINGCQTMPQRVDSASGDKLADEIKFLKSEIEQSKHAKEQMLEMKNELENIIRQKESDIAKLFAVNTRLEEENSALNIKIRRHNFEKEKEYYDHHMISRRRHRKSGLFSWLKKPIIVVNS